MSPKLSYRAEIDGLRSIAVISVILYHAQVMLFGRDWFEGGFIGVDIFFVISGYLITRVIISEIQTNGSFSFLNFYERRARRILPMLFVVILVSIPFAWQKLLPSDFIDYANSILASVFFGSNFFFYFSTTEYGADSALLKPFLHTWSLGVEEQFYLLFPIIAIVIFKFARQHFLIIIVALSFVSLQFSAHMETINADLNFYLPFSRFWELAVGSLLAYRELSEKKYGSRFIRELLSIIGMALIAISILTFDKETPHPSYWTLIPIVGVALLIEFTTASEVVGKILGSKLFVWFGVISYSAYLWHFPIFAFNRMDGSFGSKEKLALFVLTLILSYFSYQFIEKPFRQRLVIQTKTFVLMMALFTVLISSFMVFGVLTKGYEGRFTEVEFDFINVFSGREFLALKHPDNIEGLILKKGELSTSCYSRSPMDACHFGNEKIVFLGDSYVGHYERALLETFGASYGWGFVSLTYRECPFVSDELWFGGSAECPVVNEMRRSKIESFSDEKVFIISANEHQFNHPKARTSTPLEDAKNGVRNGIEVEANIAWNSYFASIRWLLNLGHKVVLIRSLPLPNIDSKSWLVSNKHYINSQNFPNVFNGERPSVVIRSDDEIFPLFESDNLMVIDPSIALCNLVTDQCLDVMEGKGPLYNGGRHLSFFGAELVSDLIRTSMLKRGWISD